MAEYDYANKGNIKRTATVEEAVRTTVINYFRNQLGWSQEKCEQRVQKELDREIPKGLFDSTSKLRGWELEGNRLIDVGAGQGAGVLEALHRGADAHGVEPGPEFATLAKRRLNQAGFEPERIHETGGEDLPFSENTFDYAISLQVLEHVEDPRPLLEEMYRVLKPGGEAVVRCENYLAFREQHYRVPWLPLLPKPIGGLYLRAIGRDPSFLNNYVFYSTYPQIWRLAADVGFNNRTFTPSLKKVDTLDGIESRSSQKIANLVSPIPSSIRRLLARWFFHARNLFSVGIGLHLAKPQDQ